MNFASALGGSERFAVKISEHQDFAGPLVLDYAGDESIEFFKCQIHTRLQKNRKPAERFAPAGRLELEWKVSL